jgi:hypothetical protein
VAEQLHCRRSRRSCAVQVVLAAKGNVQAQRAVLATIQTIEGENVFEAVLAAARAMPAEEMLAAASTIAPNSPEAVA